MTLRASSVRPWPWENRFTPSSTRRVWKCIPDPACPTAILGENDTSMPWEWATWRTTHFARTIWSAASHTSTGRNSISCWIIWSPPDTKLPTSAWAYFTEQPMEARCSSDSVRTSSHFEKGAASW